MKIIYTTLFGIALLTSCAASRPPGAEEEVDFSGVRPTYAQPAAEAPRKIALPCRTECANQGLRSVPDTDGNCGCR